jgi:ABC-type dipeptide/oligopeptide/nickel transport system permease component
VLLAARVSATHSTPAVTMLGLIVGYTVRRNAVIIEIRLRAARAGFTRRRCGRQARLCGTAILVLLLISALFIFTTWLVDVVTALLDPRLRSAAAMTDVLARPTPARAVGISSRSGRSSCSR